VALVRTDVSEERIASIIRMTRICELGTTLAVTSNNFAIVIELLVTVNVRNSPIRVTLMMEAIRSSETSVLTRVTWRHVPEDGILQCVQSFRGLECRHRRYDRQLWGTEVRFIHQNI
jgi:hypothetical protein